MIVLRNSPITNHIYDSATDLLSQLQPAFVYGVVLGSCRFQFFQFGYASAIAWSLFLLIAVISLVNFLIVRRIRSSD